MHTDKDPRTDSAAAADVDAAGYVVHRSGFYVLKGAANNITSAMDDFLLFQEAYSDDLLEASKTRRSCGSITLSWLRW